MQQKERIQCKFDDQIKGKDWIVNWQRENQDWEVWIGLSFLFFVGA
jgi:hypothetical protein